MTAPSLTALGETVRSRPQDPDAWLSYGMALHRAGQADRAMQCIRHAAALARDDARVTVRVGVAFEQLAALPEALAAGRHATRNPQAPAEAAALVGRVLTRMGDSAAAALTLQVAVNKHPESVVLRVALARALLAAERPQEAAAHVRAVLEVAPEDPALHRLDAALQAQLGNTDGYLDALGRVTRLDHEDISATVALAQALVRRGQRTESFELLVKAAEHGPQTAAAQLALGTGFLEARALTSSVRHLKAATQLQPDLAEGHLRLGTAFREAGSLLDAVAALRNAVRLAPDHAGGHYELGLALLQTQQPREASTVLIRAAALAPGDERIQDALAQALNQARQPADAQGPETGGDSGSGSGRFTGDLQLFSVAELLDFLLNQRATGTLHVRANQGEGHVELYQGSIVGARCPGSKPLSQQLLDTDLISQTDLKQAVVDPRNLERDGVVAHVLAARKLIDRTSLQDLIQRHVQVALQEMLTWSEGDAVFRRQADGEAWPEPPEIKLDTRWSLIEATRRLDEQRFAARPP